ncbi:MAG: Rieske 2Fe-2S domain-containing protein [Bacteroidetes bacterium]|nr:Rieske 2Fe-2S domain-containing protein [Bacteroidota bacterium]
MQRKEFIKTCGLACMAGVVGSPLLQSCANRMVAGEMTQTDLKIPVSGFRVESKGKTSFRTHVVAHHDKLKYPICVFRNAEKDYTALWMSCTHQGAELQVFGEKLQCPAHGSEFDRKGVVQNSPADINLRQFPVTEKEDGFLYISLK